MRWFFFDCEAHSQFLDNHVKDDTATFRVEVGIVSSRGGSEVETRDFSVPREGFDDMKLSIEGKIVHVNKVSTVITVIFSQKHVFQHYLGAHSEYFKALFSGGFKESEEEVCELKDVKHDEFIELLRVCPFWSPI